LPEDLTEISNQKIETTVKEALINARIGQGKFRTQVLKLWGNRCAVTGAVTTEAIRASHIQPWRRSTNEERLDPNNGLPLVANLDALFDAGLISFESSGEMMVSPNLSVSERRLFQINRKSLTKPPSPQTEKYLEYHRSNYFQK
jgi:predicted restriction endonuclease